MGIQHKGPGQFQVQIRKVGFPHQFKTFETELEARHWEACVLLEMQQGIFRDPKEVTLCITLHEALERYLKDITPTKKGAQQERNRIRALQKTSIASKSLSEIENTLLSQYRDLRLRSVSESTVVKELALISHLYTVAIKDWNLKIENPVSKIRKPIVKNARERMLSKGERAYILEACKKSESRAILPMVQIALETAMRKGEIISLKWENIDIETRVATLPDTKNGLKREVALSTKAVEVLRGLEPKVAGKVIPYSESGSANRAWYTAKRVALEDYVNACKAAGIGPDPKFLKNYTFHDLRHTAITDLSKRITNTMELAKMTGHKNLKIIMRYYHPSAAETAIKLI